jgi:hypothetical protein
MNETYRGILVNFVLGSRVLMTPKTLRRSCMSSLQIPYVTLFWTPSGELTNFMASSGDLIVSGGEAFNMYVDFKDRIVTSDIDAKFVPRIPLNEKYFGKLQAVKLTLWNKLGEIAKRLNLRVKKRIMSMQKKHSKLFKFLGIGFKQSGPYVTRRYSLIKKKKTTNTNKPGKGDVFIDVELFALDLNIRFLSAKTGKIEDFNMGGILRHPLHET